MLTSRLGKNMINSKELSRINFRAPSIGQNLLEEENAHSMPKMELSSNMDIKSLITGQEMMSNISISMTTVA